MVSLMADIHVAAQRHLYIQPMSIDQPHRAYIFIALQTSNRVNVAFAVSRTVTVCIGGWTLAHHLNLPHQLPHSPLHR